MWTVLKVGYFPGPSFILRICPGQFSWQSIKKCERESARRRTHGQRQTVSALQAAWGPCHPRWNSAPIQTRHEICIATAGNRGAYGWVPWAPRSSSKGVSRVEHRRREDGGAESIRRDEGCPLPSGGRGLRTGMCPLPKIFRSLSSKGEFWCILGLIKSTLVRPGVSIFLASSRLGYCPLNPPWIRPWY